MPPRPEGSAGARRDRLRTCGFDAEPDLPIPVLDDADFRIAQPVKARKVLGINRQRNIFLAGYQARLEHRDQAPRLAGQEVPSIGVVVSSPVKLAQPRRVAVGLD